MCLPVIGFGLAVPKFGPFLGLLIVLFSKESGENERGDTVLTLERSSDFIFAAVNWLVGVFLPSCFTAEPFNQIFPSGLGKGEGVLVSNLLVLVAGLLVLVAGLLVLVVGLLVLVAGLLVLVAKLLVFSTFGLGLTLTKFCNIF